MENITDKEMSVANMGFEDVLEQLESLSNSMNQLAREWRCSWWFTNMQIHAVADMLYLNGTAKRELLWGQLLLTSTLPVDVSDEELHDCTWCLSLHTDG